MTADDTTLERFANLAQVLGGGLLTLAGLVISAAAWIHRRPVGDQSPQDHADLLAQRVRQVESANLTVLLGGYDPANLAYTHHYPAYPPQSDASLRQRVGELMLRFRDEDSRATSDLSGIGRFTATYRPGGWSSSGNPARARQSWPCS